jgi:hypothetical protein
VDRSGLGVVGGCAEDEPTPSLECVEIGGQQRDQGAGHRHATAQPAAQIPERLAERL